ncbi:MAG: SDR family NAD(P)-dependent oxidoreductase [Proteobacteria bacterium]|nr:SDR family NAD(P)-dependent oxidoreductase [Pseudomonadota bacterium]
MKDFAGKTAFITGGASGIGLGMARAFADAGMNVALADIESGPLAKAKADIEGPGVDCLTFNLDVSDRGAVKQAAAETVAAFGKVHLLCNNAGVGGVNRPLDEADDSDWDWVVGVNLMGAINGLQAFLPLLKTHGEGGHIINTSSVSGLRVFEGRGQGIYATTKYALVGMSEALEQDLKPHGIGVSVLCPGFVKTALPDAARNRPDRFGGPAAIERSADSSLSAGAAAGMEPDDFGKMILAAIEKDEFYILTDSRERELIQARADRLMAAIDRAQERNF